MGTWAVLERLFSFFAKAGYRLAPPASIVSPSFPDTFSPSGGHDLVRSFLLMDSALPNVARVAGADPCFRHTDLERSGTRWHASCFCMVTYVEALPAPELSKPRMIRLLIDLLVSELGLPLERFLVTFFAGGTVKGRRCPPDHESRDIFLGLGLSANQLLGVHNEQNYLYTQFEGDGAGPRCEVFFEGTPGRGGYVELATVIYEIHRFEHGRLVDTANAVSGAGLGLERIAAVVSGLDTIYETDVFRPVIQRLVELLPDLRYARLWPREVSMAADTAKALCFILDAEPMPQSRHRRARIAKLVSTFSRTCTRLGLDPLEAGRACTEVLYEIHANRLGLSSKKAELLDRLAQRLLRQLKGARNGCGT